MMMTANDRETPIGAESRTLLRAAIRRAPGWPAYRAQNDLDMSELTRDVLFDACDALDIDIGSILSAGPQEPEEQEETPRARKPPKPAQNPTLPQEAATQLLGILAALAPKGGLDADAVRAIVSECVDPTLDTMRAAVVELIERVVALERKNEALRAALATEHVVGNVANDDDHDD